MSNNSLVQDPDSRNLTRCRRTLNLKVKTKVTSSNKIEEPRMTTTMMMMKKKFQEHITQHNMQIYLLVVK
jgi:hypothetical protein